MILKSILRDLISEYSNGRKIGSILIDMGMITQAKLDEAIKLKNKESPDTHLGEFLISNQYITESDLDKALKIQLGPGLTSLLNEDSDEAVLDKCANYGLSKELLMDRLYKKSGVEYVDLQEYKITEKMITDQFKLEQLRKNNVILFEITGGNTLKFASSEIGDVTNFKSRLTTEAQKRQLKCEFYFAFDFEIQRKFNSLSASQDIVNASGEEGSTIEFVNNIIIDGVNKEASDIHIEPKKNGLRIRYRIDGLIALNEVYDADNAFIRSVISRIKVMAGMDIAVSKKPQDGIIKDFSVSGKKYDMRISSIQVVYGEKIVIRIAPKDDTIKEFSDLGFSDRDIQKLNNIISKPTGIFFIAGATGSGKTTTLYSIINQLNTPDKNICTIEDPVEREIENINQVQVTSVDGTTNMKYADYLRSFLRQDPDIIVVGETRDRETADTAMRASLTGHFVISTVHANDALETISRMYDMDVDTFILSTTLEGLLSQRLVRKVCTKCKYTRDLTEEEKLYLDYLNNKTGRNYGLNKVTEGRGCTHCNGTGYKGRTVISEVIEIDQNIQKMIYSKTSTNEIEKYLIDNGHITMKENGLLKVMEGITSLSELKRVL